jgi:phosphatidylinositol 4-kinase
MTNTICRFLATPSPVFDLQTEKANETISVQQYAIVRLAQCVQVSFSYKKKAAPKKVKHVLL